MAMVRDVVTIQGDADPGPKPLGSPVLILGAGFSKAVHQALPITDELGERVRVRLSRRDREKLPRGRFRGGRFEEWLSYLAEDQPESSKWPRCEFEAPRAASTTCAATGGRPGSIRAGRVLSGRRVPRGHADCGVAVALRYYPRPSPGRDSARPHRLEA